MHQSNALQDSIVLQEQMHLFLVPQVHGAQLQVLVLSKATVLRVTTVIMKHGLQQVQLMI